MSTHIIKTTQNLPITLEEAWDFISSPHNLKTITPEHFGFDIINGIRPEDKMYAGQIIIYKLQPLPGMKVKWVTEISQVEQQRYFIDEQRSGPYKMWHHQHFLKTIPGGVQMDDIIHYEIPFGPIGEIANLLFVKKKLESVFEYRRVKLETLFGKM